MAPLLQSLINHIALPPKLPGKADEGLDEINDCLVTRLLQACRDVRNNAHGEIVNALESARYILQLAKELNADGGLNKASMLSTFSQLKAGDTLILHVTQQNAVVLLSR